MSPRKEAELDDVADALEELRLARAEGKVADERAKKLKEELLPIVQDLGTFYFIDSEGVKRWAYFSDANVQIVDVEELEEAIDAGLVNASVLDEVAPRKVDLEAFNTAVKAGRIPPGVARKVHKVVKGRETIRFGDPEGGD